MASDNSVLPDGDGAYSGWIEIHNREITDVDLGGWYLTDDGRDLTKWQFPAITLTGHGYLIVFASGKDRTIAGSELHVNFRLRSNGEYLALVKPDGRTIAWEYAPQYPPQFKGVSYGLVAALQERYLTAPTPGAVNGSRASNSGPILSNASHTPSFPTTHDSLVVTVAVEETFAPISTVTLHCRVMYGATIAVSMLDDGVHDDGASGDGVYGATIPSGIYRPDEMIRYYVTATDRENRTSRWPLFNDPANSPEYLGTMIADPTVTSKLPVLYWFVRDPYAAGTDAGTRASVFYDGILYDNVFVRRRGVTSKSWFKRSFKFDFNQGHHFQFLPDQDPVEEFNLISTYSDRAYIRQPLAWETYRDAGVPYSISFPMRVQQNGAFYSVAIFVEQPDERYLVRQGMDPDGALYKVSFNSFDSSTDGLAKVTRLDEDHSDLQAVIDGIHLSGEERTNYLFDHINIPAVINHLAVSTIIHDRGFGHKNYFIYRDREGTREWTLLPWDKDLTFGRNYLHKQGGAFNDIIWADHDPESHPLSGYTSNDLIDALYDTPAIQEMYLRRLRTLMDEFLQPPGTPPAKRYYEQRIDALFAQMLPDVALDADRWKVVWGTPQTFAQAIDILKNDYLAVRRVHLYDTHGPGNGGVIPGPQPATARVYFGPIEPDPASGNQDEEYFALVNYNNYAVDISGWKIVHDVEHTFQPGVVIPAGETLYVSPDVVAFRNRAVSPTGGESHLVQGNYGGRLSNRWGVLRLYNADDRLVSSRVFFNRSRFT